jgi:hypothetical protein
MPVVAVRSGNHIRRQAVGGVGGRAIELLQTISITRGAVPRWGRLGVRQALARDAELLQFENQRGPPKSEPLGGAVAAIAVTHKDSSRSLRSSSRSQATEIKNMSPMKTANAKRTITIPNTSCWRFAKGPSIVAGPARIL